MVPLFEDIIANTLIEAVTVCFPQTTTQSWILSNISWILSFPLQWLLHVRDWDNAFCKWITRWVVVKLLTVPLLTFLFGCHPDWAYHQVSSNKHTHTHTHTGTLVQPLNLKDSESLIIKYAHGYSDKISDDLHTLAQCRNTWPVSRPTLFKLSFSLQANLWMSIIQPDVATRLLFLMSWYLSQMGILQKVAVHVSPSSWTVSVRAQSALCFPLICIFVFVFVCIEADSLLYELVWPTIW